MSDTSSRTVSLSHCPGCGAEKEPSRLAVPTYCVQCRNAANIAWRTRNPEADRAARRRDNLSRNGLTPNAYDAIFDAQGHRCGICGTDKPGGRGWHIDHDHRCCPEGRRCGKCMRGILCHGCNVGLGMFQDDPDRLLAAAAYLTAWTQKVSER